MKILDYLPAVYASRLPEFFQTSFPRETLATCEHCAMCSESHQEGHSTGFRYSYNSFHPEVKCCGFHPDLPNFLVGAILASEDGKLAEGQRRIRRKIIAGAGVGPHGIDASPEVGKKYDGVDRYSFGRDRAQLCPYYDVHRAACAIWPFRQAACATYFCQSVEGVAGQVFWKSLNAYLSGVEKTLSCYAMRKTLATGGATTPPRRDESAAWAYWRGNEVAYYVATYTVVLALDRAGLAALGAPDLIGKVREAHANALCATVPAMLKKTEGLRVKRLEDGRYWYDTGLGDCVLSARAHSVVDYFDGTVRVSQVVHRVLLEKNIRLQPSFLVKLIKNGVLYPLADPLEP